ncbi:MAG: hypothetical protein IBX36_00790 [Dehalococcoidia bacterium]|nr:hypothetical protein [Dehalococcoidia bacterium]
MAEEKLESRLAGLERTDKIFLALILTSLSCSLAALILALAVLITSG